MLHITIARPILFAILFCFSFCCYSEVVLIKPSKNDTLNYTQIMFEYEQIQNAEYYMIELYSLENEKPIFSIQNSTLAKMISGYFEFGRSYEWAVIALDKTNKEITRSNKSQFYISIVKWSNPNLIKLNSSIVDSSKMYNGLIVYDYGIIANKKGEVLWFLPKTDGTFRNINLNKDGSITYNKATNAYESNLKGTVTWKAPTTLYDSIKIRNYHHDIKKLKNGNFLCLAELLPGFPTNNIYSIALELDRNNNVIWSWNDFYFYHNRKDSILSNHTNAIFKDEQTNAVYLSNRNLNSITKLKNIPNPVVEYHIGKGYTDPNIIMYSNHLFSGQHSVSILPDNNILLFNNNTANTGSPSSVLMLRVDKNTKKSPKVIWEYIFNFNDSADNISAKAGDADYLPNGNILITSGGNNRVFEVTREKKIVWSNLSFIRDKETDSYSSQSSYRAHYCSSLFPSYFTVQYTSNQTLSIAKNQLAFKINNDGSEDDSYSVSIKLPNGEAKDIEKKISVKAGRSTIVSPSFKNNTTGQLVVTITSNNNPLRSKQLVYTITN